MVPFSVIVIVVHSSGMPIHVDQSIDTDTLITSSDSQRPKEEND